MEKSEKNQEYYIPNLKHFETASQALSCQLLVSKACEEVIKGYLLNQKVHKDYIEVVENFEKIKK